ncbi:MAG: SRPBCC family protein [Reyranellaceae bacterium]
MAEVKVSQDYKADADKVWQKIRSFTGLADWMPGVQCEASDGGKTRKLTLPTGAVIVETLETFDEPGRTYGYTIVTGPLPVKDYHSVIKVVPRTEGCTVEWTGKFEAVGPEAVAKGIVEGIYRGGLAAIGVAVGG